MSTLQCAPMARGVHQDTPHHACRRRKEVRTILPMHGPPVEQPQIRLLHELGGLPAPIAMFVGKQAPSDVPQLLMHECGQGVQSRGVARIPCLQKAGQIRVVLHVRRVHT